MKRHTCTIILPTTSNINAKCHQSIQSTLPYSQSAFYPKPAVCSLHFPDYLQSTFYPWSAVRSLQSALCDLLRQDHIHCLSSELFMARFAKVCQRESNTKTFYFFVLNFVFPLIFKENQFDKKSSTFSQLLRITLLLLNLHGLFDARGCHAEI